MIKLFKSGQPLIILILLIYTLTLYIAFTLLNDVNIIKFNAFSGPLVTFFSHLFYSKIGITTIWDKILSVTVIMVQVFYLNHVLNRYRFANGINYLPGLSFALVLGLSLLFASSSIILLISFLFIIALDKFLVIYKNKRCFDHIFDIGLVTGLLGLIDDSFLIYILYMWIGLFIMRPFDLKEWLSAFLGYLTPFFLLFVYYFWIGQSDSFFFQLIGKDHSITLTTFNWWKIVSLSVILVIGFLLTAVNKLHLSIENRKIVDLSILSVILGIAAVTLNNFSSDTFITLSVPLSIFLAYLLGITKNNIVAELTHIVILLAIYYSIN